ncbi:RNA polymerase sigma-70 factor, ECF subfamily [Beijerinckia sp. 28-YEA-48]|nr:RNA polymerase sigma-70 factor, ECF subfamily [Beijerinckia sp. 28-YEA-48]
MTGKGPDQSDKDYGEMIRLIAQRRDRQAFACLFDHFAPRIRGMILRTGATVEIAEDVAQDAMLTLWRKAEYFDPQRAAPAAWVFAIARNLRIDGIRRDRRAQMHALLDRIEPEAPEQPDQRASLDERQRRVADALKYLPAEQAEVVRMSFVEGKAHGEISKCLELPLGTVKSRLRLAMIRLRQALGDLAEEKTS